MTINITLKGVLKSLGKVLNIAALIILFGIVLTQHEKILINNALLKKQHQQLEQQKLVNMVLGQYIQNIMSVISDVPPVQPRQQRPDPKDAQKRRNEYLQRNIRGDGFDQA